MSRSMLILVLVVVVAVGVLLALAAMDREVPLTHVELPVTNATTH